MKITKGDILEKALKRMGCESVQTGSKDITQYNTTEKADIWVDKGVGFKREQDGTFSMVGDFYHSTSLNRYYNNTENFEKDLNAAYGIEDTLAQVSALNLGFDLTGNLQFEEDEEGLIRLEFQSYQEM